MRHILSSKNFGKYSKDRSIYQIKPKIVLLPKSEREVQIIVERARKHKLSITPRGGGTGLSGAAIGKDIIIDFSKYMNKIFTIGKKTRVQSGCLLKKLKPKVEKKGYMLPSVPLHGDCAIGGNVNTRSVGPRSVKYGVIDKQIVSLCGVLSDGRIINTNKKIPKDIKEKIQKLQKKIKKDKSFVKFLKKRPMLLLLFCVSSHRPLLLSLYFQSLLD